MSKKRQTRNTKKMQKALGSKRYRAGYQTGGTVNKYEGVTAAQQQEIDNYFKSNKNLSSLGSHKNLFSRGSSCCESALKKVLLNVFLFLAQAL
jgi:hypothetical protein